MRTKDLLISFALGLGLVLVASWALSGAPALVTAAPSAEIHVCTEGLPTCDYASVQDAVDAAGDGDVIKVAAGTYTGVHVRPRDDITTTGVVTQVVYINKTVTIRGGYTTANWTTADPEINLTTVDAQGQGRVFYVTGDINPTIKGLRITGGDASGQSGGPQWENEGEGSGGGVYIVTATATVSSNWVFNNIADYGGGLFLERSDAVLDRNTVATSTARKMGGGLYLEDSGATLTGNAIVSNTSSSGGGGGVTMDGSPATLSGNLVAGNISGAEGGGLRLFLGTPTFDGDVIISNSAAGPGGGLYSRSVFTLVNVVIADNTAAGAGAGLYTRATSWGSPSLLHTTIARNTGVDGSGIYVEVGQDGGGSVAITNTAFVSQSVAISVTGGNTVTVNGVLWHNTPITISQSPTATVSVQNQLTGDPAFDSDGYHITPASDAIDAGVDAGIVVDMDGEARPFGSAPDLGADEWATVEVTVEPSAGSVITATVGGLTTTVTIPANAVSETTTLKYTAIADTAHGNPPGFSFAGQALNLEAYQDGELVTDFVFSSSITITLSYEDYEVAGLDEDSLVLEYWNKDTGAWEDAACGPYDRHPDQNWLAVPTCHLSEFALFGKEMKTLYLPLVLRDR